jgi:hypothetical protein
MSGVVGLAFHLGFEGLIIGAYGCSESDVPALPFMKKKQLEFKQESACAECPF